MWSRSGSVLSFRTLSFLCAGPGTGPRYLTSPPTPFVDVRYNEAFGLGYDEDGPLGLPCTEPRHGIRQALGWYVSPRWGFSDGL